MSPAHVLKASAACGPILGWRQASSAAFGFHPPTRPQERCLVRYEGDAHLLSVAPTGSGKGRDQIIPTLLTYPGPIMVIDPKGESVQICARRRRQMGQRVAVLDPFRLVTEQGDSLNPFDIFDLENGDPESDAEMLASQLSTGHHTTSDPFWSDSASGLISGLIAHVASSTEPEGRTLTAVRSLLYDDDTDYKLAALLDSRAVKSPLARDEIAAYLKHASERTRPSVLSTAVTYLKALGSQSVARSLERSTISLRDVVEGKPLSVFLVIPPEKLESHRALLRVWVATLLTAITRRKHIPSQRTLIILDETAQLGTLPLLRQAVTLLRGYGAQIWTFWQDLSQLKQLYPQDWPSIINNAAVLQAFGFANFGMAGQWGEMLGMDGHDLLRLGEHEAALFIRGEGSSTITRLNYLRDPEFVGLFDPNPRYLPEARRAIAGH